MGRDFITPPMFGGWEQTGATIDLSATPTKATSKPATSQQKGSEPYVHEDYDKNAADALMDAFGSEGAGLPDKAVLALMPALLSDNEAVAQAAEDHLNHLVESLPRHAAAGLVGAAADAFHIESATRRNAAWGNPPPTKDMETRYLPSPEQINAALDKIGGAGR